MKDTMHRLNRRHLLLTAAAAALGRGALAQAQSAADEQALPKRRDKLVLAGPFASVSYPLMRMIDSGALAKVADEVEFVSWNNPDQLRAMAIEGAADFLAVPSNVGANLYNRGVPLKLLNISVWGALWMVSREEGLETLRDFAGQEVVMPFRGDMPEIVFRRLAELEGMEVGKDIQLRYVGNPLDAMQLLITRRADHALLAEPAVSMGLSKSHSLPAKIIAPDLYRSVDMQQEWGRVLAREPRIPQAGITALGDVAADEDLLNFFQNAYAEALQWCHDEPEACGQMAAHYIPMLTAAGVADAMRVDQSEAIPASQARDELEFFFNLLLEHEPGLVGGKLPADGFYE